MITGRIDEMFELVLSHDRGLLIERVDELDWNGN